MSWADGDKLTPTNLNNKQFTIFNVKDEAYGAMGDGTTDDTAAIQSAFDSATTGATVFFSEGTYLISAVSTSKPLNLVGTGRAVIIPSSALSDLGYITFAGSLSATSSLVTTNTSLGDLQVKVNDASDFTAGDWCRIENVDSSAASFHYEFVKVLTYSGSTVYFRTPLHYTAYTTALGGKLFKLNAIEGARVENLAFDLSNAANNGQRNSALLFDYCFDSAIAGVDVSGFRYRGVEVARSKHVNVSDSFIHDSTADLAAGSGVDAGYGLDVRDASSHVVVSGNNFRHMRHGLNCGEGGHHTTITGNVFDGMYNSAIDLHFRRAENVVIDGNVISGDALQSITTLTQGDLAYGISVSSTDARISITGNVISRTRGPGIRVAKATKGEGSCTIVGNVLEDCAPTATDGEGSIYLLRTDDAVVANNVVRRTDAITSALIRASYCSGLAISNNVMHRTVAAASAQALLLADCQYVTVTGNYAEHNGTSATAYRVSSTATGSSDQIHFSNNIANVTTGNTYSFDVSATSVTNLYPSAGLLRYSTIINGVSIDASIATS